LSTIVSSVHGPEKKFLVIVGEYLTPGRDTTTSCNVIIHQSEEEKGSVDVMMDELCRALEGISVQQKTRDLK